MYFGFTITETNPASFYKCGGGEEGCGQLKWCVFKKREK